ncbi:MAG TPA: NAD-dependent epimerase/dehydratase family protein, partial [Polyangiaceae bacterium]
MTLPVFVTGGSGHVGANLIRALLARGDRVRALVRPDGSREAFAGLELELVSGDVLEPASLAELVRGCRGGYHVAARVQTVRGREMELYRTNVLGTRNVLAAARAAGAGRVVVTSSLGAVGQPAAGPCSEGDGFNPFEEHLPYEESKAWMEHECLKAAVAGQDVVIVVSTAVLGPHDFKPSRMGRVVLDFANGKLGAYIPGGFEFVSASDLAAGHLLAMEKGRSGERYIVSTQFVSVDDLMGMLETITGRRRPRKLPPGAMKVLAHISSFVLNRVAPERPQRFTPDAVRLLSLRRHADIGKARAELGFGPGSIEQALREAYESFVARGLVT